MRGSKNEELFYFCMVANGFLSASPSARALMIARLRQSTPEGFAKDIVHPFRTEVGCVGFAWAETVSTVQGASKKQLEQIQSAIGALLKKTEAKFA